MLIGVTRETRPGETRVAATPTTVGQLLKLGYDVVVESGAGALSSFADEAYVEAGARIGSAAEAWGADVVFRVNGPSIEEVSRLLCERHGIVYPQVDLAPGFLHGAAR